MINLINLLSIIHSPFFCFIETIQKIQLYFFIEKYDEIKYYSAFKNNINGTPLCN